MLILCYDNLAEPIRDADMEKEVTEMLDDYMDHVGAGLTSDYPVRFSNMLFFHVLCVHLREREVHHRDVCVLGEDNVTLYYFDDADFTFSSWSSCFNRVRYSPELYYKTQLLR